MRAAYSPFGGQKCEPLARNAFPRVRLAAKMVSEALFRGACRCTQRGGGSGHRRRLGLRNRSSRLRRSAVATARLAACAPNGGHVRAISADDLAALAASDPRFVGAELMGTALCVRCPSAFAGDFALLAHIHRGEPTVALRTLGIVDRHLPLSLESMH